MSSAMAALDLAEQRETIRRAQQDAMDSKLQLTTGHNRKATGEGAQKKGARVGF
jgi:hypothetical protein